MLGLANTVSSGSTVESLYSVNLDGTDDYVDLKTLAVGLSLADNAAYTISLWFKTSYTTGAQTENILVGVNKAGGGGNVLRLGVDVANDGIYFNGTDTGGNDSTIGSTDYADGAWYHLALSRPDGSGQNTTFYINGSSIGTSNHDVLWSDATLFFLGAEDDSGTLTDFFNGKIDEFSIWSEALDSNNIQTIYNKGGQHDLAAGRSINTANLVAYYRMGNGRFDDIANGAIHDQDNPGFGSDVVTDGGFPSLDNWDELNATGANQVTLVDGTAKITYDHTVSAGALGIRQSGILVVGKTYQVTMDVVSISGSGVKIYSGAEHAASIGTGPHVSYFVASSANFHIYRQSDASSSVTTLDNIVIRQLNGFPALTSGGPTFTSDTP